MKNGGVKEGPSTGGRVVLTDDVIAAGAWRRRSRASSVAATRTSSGLHEGTNLHRPSRPFIPRGLAVVREQHDGVSFKTRGGDRVAFPT